MALFVTGKKFIREVETAGAVGVYVPLEGGFEGRYKRRIRAAGYATMFVSAPGLGDLASYMTGIHGVRPAHVGKNAIRTYFLPPFVSYHLENLPPKVKGLVLWMYDGQTGMNLIPSTCNTTGTLWEYPLVADVGLRLWPGEYPLVANQSPHPLN